MDLFLAVQGNAFNSDIGQTLSTDRDYTASAFSLLGMTTPADDCCVLYNDGDYSGS